MEALFDDNGAYLAGHTAFENWYYNDDNTTVTVTSVEMNNMHRFDRNNNQVKNRNREDRRWFRKINDLGRHLIRWLYICCWNRGFVHGDLTTNNLLLPWTRGGRDLRGQIVVIDWWGTLTYYDVHDENYDYWEDLYKFLLDVFDVIDSLGQLIYTGHNYHRRMGEHTIGWYELTWRDNGEDYNVYDLLNDNIKYNETAAKEEERYQEFLTGDVESKNLTDDINAIFQWLNYYHLVPERFQRGFNNNNIDMPNSSYSGGTSIKFSRQKRSKTKRNAQYSKGRRVNKRKSLKLKNKKRHNSRRNIKKNSIKMAKKSRKKKVYYK